MTRARFEGYTDVMNQKNGRSPYRIKILEISVDWICQNSKSIKNIKFIKLYLTALYIKSIIRPRYSFDMKANKQSLKLI